MFAAPDLEGFMKQTTPGPTAHAHLGPLDLGALLLILLMSSFTAIAVKATVAGFPPLLGGCLRFTVAALAIALVQLMMRRLQMPRRSDMLMIILLGIICVPINQFAFWRGVDWSNPSHGAMLYANTPVMVTLLSCLLNMERWSFAGLAGAVFASVGSLVIVLNSGLHLTSRFVHGDLLLLLAAATWSLYLVLSRPLNQRYGSLNAQLYVFVAGVLFSVPPAVIDAQTMHWASIALSAWLGLLYLSLGVAVVVFFLFNWTIARQPPSRVATFSNLAYPVTLLWEGLLKGRVPSIGFAIGSALVFVGMLLAVRRRQRAVTSRVAE